jgi:hypothetical protein
MGVDDPREARWMLRAAFVGAAAFRWMAVCLPLAAAWLVLSRVVGRIARGIARRRQRA